MTTTNSRCVRDGGQGRATHAVDGGTRTLGALGPSLARRTIVCERVFVSLSSLRNEPGILHADLDAFFASVEQRDRPDLAGKPVLVGGGVIVAASYEAKRAGVRTPTNERAARSLCPNAVVVPPRFGAYLEASHAVFDCFRDVTPFVEGLSIDEAFLDVRGARRQAGHALDIARRLRRDVRERVGLPLSIGIASTKFLAKVASASAKPDGILVVPAGDEQEFLAPLPIERIWGVGPKTSVRLRAVGITTVRDLAHVHEAALAAMVGKAAAAHLHSLAWNRDPRPVVPARRRRSIGSQSALGRPRHDVGELELALLGIVDRVARRLRADGRVARTVTLRLRFGDFARATRAATTDSPTDSTARLAAMARSLLVANAPLVVERGVTLVGIALSNLVSADAVQLVLPLERPGRDVRRLETALDDVHARFGEASLTRASLVRRDRLRRAFAQELHESGPRDRTAGTARTMPR
jgi:DNA polymerase-4